MKDTPRTYLWQCQMCGEQMERKPTKAKDRPNVCCTPDQLVRVVPPMLAALLRSRGLPLPEPEHKWHPTRDWRYDLAWVEEQVAVEQDGGDWLYLQGKPGYHQSGKQASDDRHRQNEAVLRGWKVLRFSPQEIQSGEFLRTLERALKGAA